VLTPRNRLDGTTTCTRYQQSLLDFKNDSTMMQMYSRSFSYYQSLWSTVFQPAFPQTMANFFYAYDLYDYARFEFDHNPQIRNALNESGLEILETLAASQQRELNADLTESGKYAGDLIRAISGRMLATKVATQLRVNYASAGRDVKMSLMFGGFKPFISLFALTNLNRSPWAKDFEDIPKPGAAMVFELFSENTKNLSLYPMASELRVRFLYRPSADPGVPFTEYALFSNSTTQRASMPFNDFYAAMDGIGVDSVSTWCDMCDSPNLFCTAFESNQGWAGGSGSSSRGGAGVTAPVAGVIGAVVTLAVFGLAGLAAVLLGGVRLYRTDKTSRNSGGFKGPEKMASDLDIAVSGRGARHERVGSWELRGGGSDVRNVGAVLDKDTAVSNIRNTPEDDDAISVMGATPVRPREAV
jgi:hypothetical protein